MTDTEIQIHRLETAYLKGRSRARFRGGALDTVARTPLGKGHNNEEQPFNSDTAWYTKPIFAEYDLAIRNGWRRKICLLAGVKTTKSLDLEICALDHACHRRGDTAIYFGTEKSAEDTATTRIWDYFKGNEYFLKKMESLASRHADTMGAMKFPDKTVFILSANESNTQQKNLAFVGLQDAFLTGKTGMIKQMIARTTQYPDAIVFLESQGGEKGFDFDSEYDGTDQRELHVLCPHCASQHIFNWKAWDERHMTRPEDFKPTPPKSVVSLDSDAWIHHHQPLLKGRCAGFQKTDPSQKDLSSARHSQDGDDGHDYKFNESDILRNTHFECFHCGSLWLDEPVTRVALDRSCFYVAARPEALTQNVGFNFPQWINTRLKWGTMMIDRLNANAKANQFGNYIDIQLWWQKIAARTWDPLINKSRLLAVNVSSYAPEPGIHAYGDNWHCRQMTVDCGKAPDAKPDEHRIGKLFFEIRDVSKGGSSRQVSRGVLTSTPEDHDRHWKLLAAQQEYWNIPNNRVGIDTAYMPSQVEDAAVTHFQLIIPAGMEKQTVIKVPVTWRLLLGAGANRLTLNSKGQTYLDAQVPGMRTAHDPAVGGRQPRLWRMYLQKTSWSNFRFEEQFEAIIMKTTGVQWEILERNKIVVIGLDGKPSDELTRQSMEYEAAETNSWHPGWESQLNSRFLSEEKKAFLDYDKQSRPTEARDLALMHLVLMARDGLLGHISGDNK